ncbi:MAG: hypothetical protein HOQ18_15955 [Dermatophilaceae bacterium]|nr:hypothetical protein [Dermatophilaceae bacterium]NUR16160.1 hypothetical protein [Dermatophilaceae bacterium]
MAAHDVMEVTTMEHLLGLGTADDLDLDVDAAFAEIVLADDELVDLEFEALMSAEFGGPHDSGDVPHDDPGDGRPRPGPRGALAPRARPAARIATARRRNRQRSPPPDGLVFSCSGFSCPRRPRETAGPPAHPGGGAERLQQGLPTGRLGR